ncbi:hypothetical protein [Xanthocytophaga flava]|uniref:hypothetical protein n=1 Tax=Xanthocytophaga flava TaxID=3048013 RepID=UPI0028D8C5CB|nr:hypothetical protein [Xanthocytophaga flavus]MDJ1471188.1 hypothetical protein [Xanthocytophaga flavus]
MPKIAKHVEKAILEMPQKEKDKLLIRLISKDTLLTEKLEHQLLGDDNDTLDRRNELLQQIIEMASNEHYDTPGWLMMAMREKSGQITRHEKVTKDKFGEVVLLLALINEPFTRQKDMLEKKSKRADNFAEYVVKRARIIVNKAEKLHSDYYVEIEERVNDMLTFIHKYQPCRYYLETTPLPKSWNP